MPNKRLLFSSNPAANETINVGTPAEMRIAPTISDSLERNSPHPMTTNAITATDHLSSKFAMSQTMPVAIAADKVAATSKTSEMRD